LRDPRQVRLRGPGGRQTRVLVPVGRTVRQGQATAVRAAPRAGRRVVRGAGGAGQRYVVRLHRLHQEPVRHGQRTDDQPERHG